MRNLCFVLTLLLGGMAAAQNKPARLPKGKLFIIGGGHISDSFRMQVLTTAHWKKGDLIAAVVKVCDRRPSLGHESAQAPQGRQTVGRIPRRQGGARLRANAFTLQPLDGSYGFNRRGIREHQSRGDSEPPHATCQCPYDPGSPAHPADGGKDEHARSQRQRAAPRGRGHSVRTRFDRGGVHCPDVMLRVDQGSRTDDND